MYTLLHARSGGGGQLHIISINKKYTYDTAYRATHTNYKINNEILRLLYYDDEHEITKITIIIMEQDDGSSHAGCRVVHLICHYDNDDK